MRNCNYIGVFYALLQAGLWEKDVQLLQYGRIDFNEVIQLAEEQSVVGLVTAGLEHVKDAKIPHDKLIPFIGRTLQIEQRNKAMNDFIAKLINLLNKNGIKALLVKGQGVAQCYERPLWRACGDVDLLLDAENYEKAKELLIPLASSVEDEDVSNKHLGMHIKGFVLELHGRMPFAMSKKVEHEIDNIITDSLSNGCVKIWENNDTEVLLPANYNHLILVFTHFLGHFFIEGIGLRQICDWCRMLWAYRSEIDIHQLELCINRMGLRREWKAFAAFAVDYLGMPVEAMPFFDVDHNNNLNDNLNGNLDLNLNKYRRKAKKINDFILMTGNFGHNRDLSYRIKYTGTMYYLVSLWRRLKDFIEIAKIFPLDAPKFFVTYLMGKVKRYCCD